jgi:lysozyme family protein
MNEPPKAGAKAGAGALALAIAGILAAVYANEGGYVNHPADPGGPTNHGVTEKVARKHGYRGDMRDFQKHCSERHAVCADKIYTQDYIEKPGFMPLVAIEPAVADEMVDTGVNMGPHWPSQWFQQSLNELSGAGLTVDGRLGPNTVAAYRAMQTRFGKFDSCVMMLAFLDDKQKGRYDRLVSLNPRNKVFYRGWIRTRIGNVARNDCGRGWA